MLRLIKFPDVIQEGSLSWTIVTCNPVVNAVKERLSISLKAVAVADSLNQIELVGDPALTNKNESLQVQVMLFVSLRISSILPE